MRTSANHIHTPRQIGEDYAFTGSVNPDDENRAAHGCITYTEACAECGAERSVNRNQWHVEYGPWGPTRAERDAAERKAREKREREARAAEEAAVAAQRAAILNTSVDSVLVSIRGEAPRWIWRLDIQEAATQPDTGDGVVLFYLGLQRAVAEYEHDRA